MPKLTVAIAQFNAVLGDIEGNASRIAALAADAARAGADLLVTPELALCGYPPEDLLLRPDFLRACDAALDRLAASCGSAAVLVGHPMAIEGRRYNAATLLVGGLRVATYRKQRLPNYSEFDEERYFEPGESPCIVTLAGVRCGIAICEDVWLPGVAEQAKAAGAELLLTLNASPFFRDKQAKRVEILRERVVATGLPMAYVNLVGGQDELVFDGGSLAFDADGRVAAELPRFEEGFRCLSLDGGRWSAAERHPSLAPEDEVYRALVLGVRDYLGKNRFPGAIIGLSGGIDSALTLCVAVDALGPDRVRAVMMPSPYTAQMSLDDSRALVRTLGIRYDEIAIAPAMEVFDRLLQPQFAGLPADTTEENVQARVRGNLLMALSNKTGWLVLTTGNKSEMAVGYCTLYGDMAGGFAVIKDVPKTFVYRLSRWINREREVIPWNIIERPPSAELRPDQTDQDSLPPYEVLDAIVEAYMEQDRSPREIVASGIADSDVRRVVRLLRIAEYKRRQAPVGIRITPRGFGKDWRYPITNRYVDEW
jgi:NAD+ synthase/NAD+ synthase (glutamine-hydrolysing)